MTTGFQQGQIIKQAVDKVNVAIQDSSMEANREKGYTEAAVKGLALGEISKLENIGLTGVDIAARPDMTSEEAGAYLDQSLPLLDTAAALKRKLELIVLQNQCLREDLNL